MVVISQMTSNIIKVILTLLVAHTVCAPPVHAQGTIRYVDNFNEGFGDIDRSYLWDVNGDGSTDFLLSYDGQDFDIFPEEGNLVIAIAEPPPDLGSLVVPLNAWAPIGDFDYSPAQWTPTTFYNNGEFPIGSGFNACASGVCYGLFNNVEAPFGFQFQAEDGTHYGWANLTALGGGVFGGGLITDYAYNTVPGEMILAGQVPEPSTWALLATGGSTLWLLRRRHCAAGKE